MTGVNQIKQLVRDRLKLILQLIKNKASIKLIEREIAILTLDLIQFPQNRNLLIKEGCYCFKKINYALDQKMHNQLSEETLDLLNEGLLLDEIGSTYGADVNLMLKLAPVILQREAKPVKVKTALRLRTKELITI